MTSLAPALDDRPRGARNTKGRPDHWWLLASLGVVVLGFWPSFFRSLRAQDLAHTLHGFTASGWLVGLVLQAWLIDRGERAWHRRVAQVMITMGVAMVVTSIPMMEAILRSGLANANFRPLARMLVVYDVTALMLFTALFSVALANVRRPAVHRRALAATAMLAIPPALARYLSGSLIGLPFMTALHASFWFGNAIMVWLIARDRRDGVRDVVWPVMLACMIALELCMAPVSRTAWWWAFSDAMAR
jgi:hypothetical protein